MEAFVPSIEDQLRQRVAAAVKSALPETEHATVTLTSFQFAFDQREDIQGEYQAKYVNWANAKEREDDERQARRDERTDTRMHERMDKNESLGSSVGGELFMAAFTLLFIDLPRSLARKQETQTRIAAEAQTLPAEITDSKQTGLNCRIHATVIFAGRQGTEVERTIRIDRHTPLSADGSLKDQTAVFIEAALEEFSSSI